MPSVEIALQTLTRNPCAPIYYSSGGGPIKQESGLDMEQPHVYLADQKGRLWNVSWAWGTKGIPTFSKAVHDIGNPVFVLYLFAMVTADLRCGMTNTLMVAAKRK